MEESFISLLDCLSLSSLLKLCKLFLNYTIEDLTLDKKSLIYSLSYAYMAMDSMQRYDVISAISDELGYSKDKVMLLQNN